MAPTAKDCVARAVPVWSHNQCDVVPTAAGSRRQQRSWRQASGASTMSDADTESSTGSVAWRHASFTASESDGPRIVVHTTSEDEEEDEVTLDTVTLLRVALPISDTTTDIGSDCTSEGCESGHESSLEVKAVEVTAELATALVTQVEEYLSDEGLSKDLFLLKHVKRHRDGFVSLKLLSGYKKVKKLSRDWRVLAMALQASQKLQLNDAATKVRRRAPLPSTLLYDAPASRSLVAANIPAHQATMANLAVLFGSYGAVASLQVVRPRPEGGVPPALQCLATRLPELAVAHCAIVEYESVWGAARALHHLDNPPITLHILRRSRRPSTTSSRTSPTPTSTPRGRGWYEYCVPAEELRQRLKGTRSRLRRQKTESSASESDDRPVHHSWRRNSHQLTPQSLPNNHLFHFHRSQRVRNSTPTSPVTHRRNDNPGITRCPQGPDGTRGFSMVRS